MPDRTAAVSVAPPAGRGAVYWPALDGVRALAVTAVLLFHGGVSWLPGGFLGVDAFFVLSGFLITSLLLAERESTGRIRLGRFWVRRARRLLPALLAMLIFVVAAFRDLLPPVELRLLRGDALAALGYVANWRMIYRGDDYFAQTSAPSALQHTWSLGIEEQFYLVWPLLVVLLGALWSRRSRRVLAAVCLAGAVASAVAGGLLFSPYNVNRAYFGTDTRSQALLVGCAAAAALPGLRRWLAARSGRAVALRSAALTIGAVAGVLGVAWLWTRADGSDSWLYRGGFFGGALGVAILLVHVVLRPAGLPARVLGLAPLVWLGRISYGVYLWHWPLFVLLNADRTGFHGPLLLLARLGATLAVSVVSYVLVEQPIRTGRWPLRARPPRIRLRPAVGAAGATAAVSATAAFILVATMPPPPASMTPVVAVPTALPSAATTTAGEPTPMQRPDRKPGAEPRIAFFGDSVSWTLGTYLQQFPGLSITTEAMPGCGIARLPDIIYVGDPHTNYPECPTWDATWRARVNGVDPDVAVVLLDRWELMDRKLGNTYMHVGQLLFDKYLKVELELALSIVGSHGAHIVLLTAPYTHRAERPDGGLYDEDQPARVDAWNRLLREVAAERPQQRTIIDLNARVCPDGKFTWRIGQLQIRSDGLHFTPEAVQQWIAPWLVPQLASIAVYGPRTTHRGD